MKPIYVKFKKEDDIMVETTKKFIEETKGTMRDFIKYMVDDGVFEC